ncbi:non-specific lipid transfer protein GPI-anchored 30-like [Andrographis paniculata]|uniref:non-specific lipid transfer protein GPI-anchored 30-like n=1 Tax=Andrographis paniculata TaxID=175694 RepID=UPI0021E6F2E6|nr:non-specific lipid transfer protein GPI-anchored 30-like [Andrographis paniculata]
MNCCVRAFFLIMIVLCSSSSSSSCVSAQVQRQDCMDSLQPCLNYLNGNRKPPDACCRPLDYVVRSAPECLCSLMTLRGSSQAERAGINVTDAQTLPGRCGLRINPLGCVTGTPDTPSSSAASSSSGSGSATAAFLAAALILATLQAL